MAYPEIGKKAPEFNLLDQNGDNISLSDFAGQYVCLYFYPKALTPGCIVQAVGIRDDIREFEQAGIKVLGVSPDEPARLKKFEEKQGLNFTLLSDPEHKLAELYGTWVEKNMYGRKYFGFERTTFIIGKDGELFDILSKVKPKEHVEKVLKIITTK